MRRAGPLIACCLLLVAAAPARASRTVYPDFVGNLHVFVVGDDGQLYHAASTGRGAWKPFEGLGGSLLPGPVAVGRNADGRLAVFARGTNSAIWQIAQTAPGGGWSAWQSLAGTLAGPPDVAPNPDGRLEVFARGPGSALWHAWQTSPGGSWSGWSSLGEVLTSEPAVIPWSTDLLVVWARNLASHAEHIWQNAPGGAWSAWADDGGLFTGAPVPSLDADGRQEAFGRGTSDLLYHRWQAHLNADWVPDWAGFGGVQLNGDPAIARDSAGRLHAFARGKDNALWHTWQTAPNGTAWAPWSSLGGQFAGDPVLRKDGLEKAPGALQVFATGADGAVYSSDQTGTAPDGWSRFLSLGRPAAVPTPLAGPAPASPPRRLVITLGFNYKAGKRSTRLTKFVVKDVPRGATVDARCARGCSRKSLVKRSVPSTKVGLSALVKRKLKVGTKITITVTASGTIGAVKTLTIRRLKAPNIRTRCLPPGAAKPTNC